MWDIVTQSYYERTQKSPFLFCSAAQAQESFLLKAVGTTRWLFLSFFFVKKLDLWAPSFSVPY